jgi:hypothetical protein
VSKPRGEQPETVKVQILTDNHTHRGEIVPPGTVIEVDENTAAWLEREQVGKKEA